MTKLTNDTTSEIGSHNWFLSFCKDFGHFYVKMKIGIGLCWFTFRNTDNPLSLFKQKNTIPVCPPWLIGHYYIRCYSYVTSQTLQGHWLKKKKMYRQKWSECFPQIHTTSPRMHHTTEGEAPAIAKRRRVYWVAQKRGYVGPGGTGLATAASPSPVQWVCRFEYCLYRFWVSE